MVGGGGCSVWVEGTCCSRHPFEMKPPSRERQGSRECREYRVASTELCGYARTAATGVDSARTGNPKQDRYRRGIPRLNTERARIGGQPLWVLTETAGSSSWSQPYIASFPRVLRSFLSIFFGYPVVNWRNQAITQVCAVCSPIPGSMSVMAIYRQLRPVLGFVHDRGVHRIMLLQSAPALLAFLPVLSSPAARYAHFQIVSGGSRCP
jgi:hypothetical protein